MYTKSVAGRLAALGLLALAGPGCGATPPEPPPEPVERGAAADDLTARPPSRGPVLGGERMVRTVTWPDEASRDATVYASLDSDSRAAVDAAVIPVLVPDLEVALDQRKVMRGPAWYAFWGQRDGVTVTVHASRVARVHPGVRPRPGTHALRDRDGFVTRNEGIWAASWVEHGVAYDLELECAPPDAPDCADESTVMELAEHLVYVGGNPNETVDPAATAPPHSAAETPQEAPR